jgi:hypothetical protein
MWVVCFLHKHERETLKPVGVILRTGVGKRE